MKNLYFIKTSWRGYLIVASNREIAQEKLFDNMIVPLEDILAYVE